MPFQKGKSGNPGGRSTEKEYQAALRAAVNADDPKTKRRKLLLIAEKAADLAVAGEAWAVAHVADRLDGKPAQESTVHVNRVSAQQLGDDELADIAAGSGEGAAEPPVDPSKFN